MAPQGNSAYNENNSALPSHAFEFNVPEKVAGNLTVESGTATLFGSEDMEDEVSEVQISSKRKRSFLTELGPSTNVAENWSGQCHGGLTADRCDDISNLSFTTESDILEKKVTDNRCESSQDEANSASGMLSAGFQRSNTLQSTTSFNSSISNESDSFQTLESSSFASCQSQVSLSSSSMKQVSKLNSAGPPMCCLICTDQFSKKQPAIKMPCKNNCNEAPVHAKCIYEWREAQNTASLPSCPLCRGELDDIKFSPPDILKSHKFHDLRVKSSFLNRPAPFEAGFIRCFLKVSQNRISKRSYRITYELFLQAPTTFAYPLGAVPDGKSPRQGDRLLCFATKIRGCKANDSELDIFMERNATPNTYIGKFSTQAKGSINAMFVPKNGLIKSDFKIANEPKVDSLRDKDWIRNNFIERAAISYAGFRCTSGPKQLLVRLPLLANTEATAASKNLLSANQELPGVSDKIKNDSERQDSSNASLAGAFQQSINGCEDWQKRYLFAQNRAPYWLESLQAYTLDFRGRVTLPSNKNFQLLLWPKSAQLLKSVKSSRQKASDTLNTDFSNISNGMKCEDENMVLQFGKVGELFSAAIDSELESEVFTLDFKWPLSPLQALAIGLSACDRTCHACSSGAQSPSRDN